MSRQRARPAAVAARASALLVTALAAVAAALAQPAEPLVACDGAALESRVIQVRFKPVSEAARLVDQLLGPCGAYRVPKALKVLTVEDDPERLDSIEEALASWDLPPRNVEVTVSLILARRDGPGAGAGDIVGDIRGVTETLSEVTSYTSFERVGTTTVLASEGRSASLDLGDAYRVALRIGAVDPRRGIVQIEPLTLMKLPAPDESGASLAVAPRRMLSMELDLPEGKVHLVGAPGRERDRAIFLAVTVWTVDDDAVTGVPAAAGEE